MSSDLRGQIHDSLSLKETDELLEIWTTNDRVEWSETAFEVLKEILEQRLAELPAQKEPVLEYVEREIKDGYENLPVDRLIDPDNAPVFYSPKEVVRTGLWINRVAAASVVITILTGLPEFGRIQRVILTYFMEVSGGESFSWLSALLLGTLLIGLQCFIVYFSLKSLASLLNILMEMEFNSRPLK